VSSEESRTDSRDAMDAAVQHLCIMTLYLYFEEVGGHDLVICCWYGTLAAWFRLDPVLAEIELPDKHLICNDRTIECTHVFVVIKRL
jgi:hypothetical protein